MFCLDGGIFLVRESMVGSQLPHCDGWNYLPGNNIKFGAKHTIASILRQKGSNNYEPGFCALAKCWLGAWYCFKNERILQVSMEMKYCSCPYVFPSLILIAPFITQTQISRNIKQNSHCVLSLFLFLVGSGGLYNVLGSSIPT